MNILIDLGAFHGAVADTPKTEFEPRHNIVQDPTSRDTTKIQERTRMMFFFFFPFFLSLFRVRDSSSNGSGDGDDGNRK